ncbi:hypothetical protein AB0B45_03460 [Nonomuraea sp. NPDC049152]|uniref:hypothetical protein n=1 Tax=Nonomuraea sp. NPDC049152 TaxID=3154350 RepID=UPI0033F5DFC6
MEPHDVQALSDTDLAVYEAVAAIAVGGDQARVADVSRMAGLSEDETKQSIATLVAMGQVVPKGEGYALGRHDFGLEY